MTINKWDLLLNNKRRKDDLENSEEKDKKIKEQPKVFKFDDQRTEFEKDQDRVAFSTPLRRLADKTQVFPLEKNDSVRTRLTHSLEVANIAWNFGVRISTSEKVRKEIGDDNLLRKIPPILRATALMHDCGNPPFGHQGEKAIREWFSRNEQSLLKGMAEDQRGDFLFFEGNAQGFRLITKLQLLNDKYGLDLTYATLATFLKYPFPSGESREKYGFFFSERDIVKVVHEKTGLSMNLKHPLNYLMEASDDIAYSTMDVEDAVKKEIVSFHDLIAYLEKKPELIKEKKKAPAETESEKQGRLIIEEVVKFGEDKILQYSKMDLHPKELSMVLMERMRAYLIALMSEKISESYVRKIKEITKGEKVDLFVESNLAPLKDKMTSFAREYAYRHSTVLEMELKGKQVIQELMDILWIGIKAIDKKWKQRTAEENFVISKISKNYVRVYENENTKEEHFNYYHKLRLLTDMISGMTDSYAVTLHEELSVYFRKGN